MTAHQAGFWTHDRITRIKTMWADGHSASQIGNEVGASRCAVIGKLHRIGLTSKDRTAPLRPTQRKPRAMGIDGGLAHRIYVRRSPKPPLIFGNLALKEEIFEPVALELPTEHQCALLSLRNEFCRYPVTGDAPYLFCGIPEADVASGRSYCRGHHAICHRRT